MKLSLIVYFLLSYLGIVGIVGIWNAIKLPYMASGPYSLIIQPLYDNDTKESVAAKIKSASSHSTLDPTSVLPVMPHKK